ncbi:hypothetical protein PR048_012637 [Dryococelus australis]|uniref:Uncharacterized protein n=1 Tax=Dryococelus australis TaxID=614101 RepID=A0ABQ9HPY1_9NEOP|nr:hypothetical protein PR048_012637 [Dryococelus australis]
MYLAVCFSDDANSDQPAVHLRQKKLDCVKRKYVLTLLETNSVTAAEVMLALDAVMSSQSARSVWRLVGLALNIFPDSAEANKINLAEG